MHFVIMITITKEQSYELGERLCRIMELAKQQKGKHSDEIVKHAMTCFRWVTRKQIQEFRNGVSNTEEGC